MSGAVIGAVDAKMSEAGMSGSNGEEMRPSQWIILRCSASHTLALADVLGTRGLAVWTPRAMVSRRVPRRRVKVEPRPVPVLPCYVFADADDVDVLHRLHVSDVDELGVRFSILLLPDRRVARVSDRQLEVLRELERRLQRKAPRGPRPVFRSGQRVAVQGDVAWSGMSGVVETADRKWALVCFGGKVSVKIDALHLHAAAA